MPRTPVLAPEEYIEQAYFFRVLRERLADGQAAQDVLAHIVHELLSTTRLPLAVQFMSDELKHSGLIGVAFAKLPHYFTPFQSYVVARAEEDNTRFTFEQALLVLEREADYRSGSPSAPGLFTYQLEAISRNRLGYSEGLAAMEQDEFYNEDWRAYIRLVRTQLGARDFAELVFARSEYYCHLRRASDPDYEPSFKVLFEEKEGKIGFANRGKDPMFLFATLQRQLGYPEVPRPVRQITQTAQIAELTQKIQFLESRLSIVEGELTGKFDLSKYYVKPEEQPPKSADHLD